jgi:hypothetical protein
MEKAENLNRYRRIYYSSLLGYIAIRITNLLDKPSEKGRNHLRNIENRLTQIPSIREHETGKNLYESAVNLRLTIKQYLSKITE